MKAPYSSTHLRVPVPIKEILQEIVELYKEDLNVDNIKGILESSKGVERQAVSPDSTNLLTSKEAIEIAKKILTQKKSAKVSLSKLLTAIYGEEVVL